MRRRIIEEERPQVEIPQWITHLEAGLRHIGHVTPEGFVFLDRVEELYAAREAWCRENGLDPARAL